MRTAVAETSLLAYDALRAGPRLTAQQQRILAHLTQHPHRDWTRKELSQALGMEPGTVAGRCNELLALPVPPIEELAIRRCAVSGNSARPVRLARAQRDLFA